MSAQLAYIRGARHYLLETARSFDPACRGPQRLEAYRTFCLALQLLSYGALLSEANPSKFSLNQMRAAVNWKALLEHVRNTEPGFQVPASMNGPLLGAICCGPLPFACELAELSARTLTPPEYDDEFLGAFFLQEYLRSRVGQRRDVADLLELCDQIARYLDDEPPRVRVFRALARGHEQEFWEVFQEWNEVSAHELETRAEAPGAPTSLALTRYVWLEGLALLKLAEDQGFSPPSRHYRLIPFLAHSAPSTPPGTSSLLLGGNVRESDL